MIYLYYRDKYEKEPLKTLFKAFIGGAFAFGATLFVVIPLDAFFSNIHEPFQKAFTEAFFVAAIPEEFFKFLFLYLFIWKDKNFNEKYDGIIYAAFVSLGFAFIENLLYVVKGGVGVGIGRAIFSVPGHALDGVIMGYYFSLARFSTENKSRFFLMSLGFAVLAHGIYDFLLMYFYNIAGINPYIALLIVIIFFVFIFKLWKIGLNKIKSHIEASVFKNADTENKS